MEKEEIKEKEEKVEKEEKKKEKKQKKPLVSCRILFISALDKIMFVILALSFVGATWANFSGNFGSPDYRYWARVFSEIGILIAFAIQYFLFNWIYKCAAKTMLCITDTEVYKEAYIPFKRTEKSIPLKKITSVTTINLFWIFRSVIIFQYHHLPMIFFTWKNQEFKDKFDELVNHRTEEMENEYEDKNIISFLSDGFIKKFFIGLAALIVFLGIIRIFGVLFSPARKVPGTYTNGDYKIEVKRNGTCDIATLKKDAENCKWTINDDGDTVTFSYEYDSWWGKDTSSFDMRYENKKLTYGDQEFTK